MSTLWNKVPRYSICIFIFYQAEFFSGPWQLCKAESWRADEIAEYVRLSAGCCQVFGPQLGSLNNKRTIYMYNGEFNFSNTIICSKSDNSDFFRMHLL